MGKVKKQKIKNIEKASDRIKKAVQNKERIILYGDSDLDGISSVVILEEAIKNLGGHVDCAFFPDRETDGYGINLKALEMLKKKAPALLITLDLGIGNVKEVDVANKLGFEVIIVDHHEPLVGVPNASIIVDPKQYDDPYPFKGLADVGVAYNLCLELLGDKISSNLKNSFLELTAMGTIADMVPQTDQNQEIIEEGLRSLRNTFRPAFKTFLEILGEGRVFEDSLPKIISALNSAESLNFENESYLLLTSSDKKQCKELAQKLLDNTNYKQIQIKNITQEVERRIAQKPDETIVFEGDPAWKLVLAGSVASTICAKYGKPAFIFRKMDKESSGSVRNPHGTNSVDAMATCSDFLITYGGHANASGFRVKNEYLDKFKNKLTEYFKKGK
ncbi:MAG: DHH family phosphoesterase [Candidatus Staskawiczbacteria bacterium]|nr:DHH family phosphoesterase [Candidatus Staskawiczbacteria bacterium]